MGSPSLASVERNICSFLISGRSNNGLPGRTEAELEYDYKDIYKRDVPYRELGVRGMADILSSLHAQRKVYCVGDVWRAGRVEGAEKIQKMVAQTKTVGKSGRLSSQAAVARGRARGAAVGGRGAFNRTGTRPPLTFYASGTDFLHSFPPPPPQTPAHIQSAPPPPPLLPPQTQSAPSPPPQTRTDHLHGAAPSLPPQTRTDFSYGVVSKPLPKQEIRRPASPPQPSQSSGYHSRASSRERSDTQSQFSFPPSVPTQPVKPMVNAEVECMVCGGRHSARLCPNRATGVPAASKEPKRLASPARTISPSSAKQKIVCTACGEEGHAGGPQCPYQQCLYCGALGAGHGTLGCTLACCFCTSPKHKGRFCLVGDPRCRSSAYPHHTNACLDTHLHTTAFRFTKMTPAPGVVEKKGRGRGRLVATVAPLLPGKAASPPAPALPLPTPSPARPQTSKASSGEDLKAAGNSNVVELISQGFRIKHQDGAKLILPSSTTTAKPTTPEVTQESPEPPEAPPSYQEVKEKLNRTLFEMEEQGTSLPVTRLSYGLSTPPDAAWERSVLQQLNAEMMATGTVCLFKFDRDEAGKTVIALKTLSELLLQLECLLLQHKPFNGRVSGGKLREWWLMDAENGKEAAFLENLHTAPWPLRLVIEWFATPEGDDYFVSIGIGGTFPLPVQPLPENPDLVEVAGSCVHHAGEFYVRLGLTDQEYRDLRLELDTYLRKYGDWEPLRLDFGTYPRGELVAALHGKVGKTDKQAEKVWWRGRLSASRPPDPDGVWVDIFDKGTIVKVGTADVRRLPWYFMKLPVQAVRCHWETLKPVPRAGEGGEGMPWRWGKASSDFLRDTLLPELQLAIQDLPATFTLRLRTSGKMTADGQGVFVRDVERTEAGGSAPLSIAAKLVAQGIAVDSQPASLSSQHPTTSSQLPSTSSQLPSTSSHKDAPKAAASRTLPDSLSSSSSQREDPGPRTSKGGIECPAPWTTLPPPPDTEESPSVGGWSRHFDISSRSSMKESSVDEADLEALIEDELEDEIESSSDEESSVDEADLEALIEDELEDEIESSSDEESSVDEADLEALIDDELEDEIESSSDEVGKNVFETGGSPSAAQTVTRETLVQDFQATLKLKDADLCL